MIKVVLKKKLNMLSIRKRTLNLREQELEKLAKRLSHERVRFVKKNVKKIMKLERNLNLTDLKGEKSEEPLQSSHINRSKKII